MTTASNLPKSAQSPALHGVPIRYAAMGAVVSAACLLWPVLSAVAQEGGPREFRDLFNYPLGDATVETTEQIGQEDPTFQGAKVELVAIVTSAGILVLKSDEVEESLFDLPTNQQSELLRGQLVIPELDLETKVFRTIDIADADAPEQVVILSTASPGTGRDCSRGGQQCRQGNGG